MKHLICALALFSTLAPALAQDQDAATPPVAADIGIMEERPDIPTRTDDGLAITPLEMPVDHISAMLGIQMWQFKIEPPQNVTPETMLNYRLELRRPGQNPIEMSSGGSGFAIYGKPHTMQLTFGLMPDGKERFATSDRWRVYDTT